MKKDERVEEVWKFDFCLESQDGSLLPAAVAERLLDAIIAWVEDNGCQIGGGYRTLSDAENCAAEDTETILNKLQQLFDHEDAKGSGGMDAQ